jgi:hypothetical protein
MQRLGRRLGVDPGVCRENQVQLGAALDRRHPPQLRQKSAESGFGRLRRSLTPEEVDQGVARRDGSPLEHEIREQQPPLSAGKEIVEPGPLDPDGKRAAQLNPGLSHPCTIEAKVAPRSAPAGSLILALHRREGGAMGLRIDCECGEVVRAESDDDLVAKVEAHVESDHPELVGKLTRDDVMGMAVEDD